MLIRGFVKLLDRYKEGTLPASVRKAMDIWFHSLKNEPIESNEKAEIGDRIWLGIKAGMANTDEIPLATKVSSWTGAGVWKYAAAASIFLGMLFYFSRDIIYRPDTPAELAWEVKTKWIKITNDADSTRKITLSDGSKVVMEAGSELRYPSNFESNSRAVFFEGSGFFDVTRDSDRPFIVYSGAVLTRVLGTSFTIKAIPQTGGTEVAVVTGKVMVEKARRVKNGTKPTGEGIRIVLTPNKTVTFFKDSHQYVTGLVASPVLLTSQKAYLKPGAFNFDETPLAEILQKLEKAYGIEISVSNDEILSCPVTADLTSDNLYEKIEIIGAVLNASYEITGNSILLTGGGCTELKSNDQFNRQNPM
jgi:transmembrane sensor